MNMNISQVVQSVDNMSAGVTYVVGDLSDGLTQLGHKVTIYAFGDHPRKWPYSTKLINNYNVLEKINLISIDALNKLRKNSLAVDVMHGHGIWRIANLFPLFLPRSHQPKIVWSPHGMLSDWSWRHRYVLKLPFWLLFQKSAIKKVDCFHATATSEYHDIRRRGLTQPVAIVPNAVDIPELNNPSKKKNIVFLSRIHKKKGLEILLETWQSLQNKYNDWNIIIAGPLNSKYADEVQEYARHLKLNNVSFIGEVYGEQKKELLATSSLFILPSFSENFGIVIAEALAHGTPVITTTETPWKELQDNNCGLWVNPNRDEITKALDSSISLSLDELEVMGKNGRQWMERDYSHQAMASKMTHVYHWLIGEKEKPEWVFIE